MALKRMFYCTNSVISDFLCSYLIHLNYDKKQFQIERIGFCEMVTENSNTIIDFNATDLLLQKNLIKSKNIGFHCIILFESKEYSNFHNLSTIGISENDCYFFEQEKELNTLILEIAQVKTVRTCMEGYQVCLNAINDESLTFPSKNSLISNYVELNQKKLVNSNIHLQNLEFYNSNLWDLNSHLLKDFKYFLDQKMNES